MSNDPHGNWVSLSSSNPRAVGKLRLKCAEATDVNAARAMIEDFILKNFGGVFCECL